MSERIDRVIAELEREEQRLDKLKKPTVLDQLRLLAVSCDLASRRRERASQHLGQLRTEVEQAKRRLVDARASGQGERQALRDLEEAERRHQDRDTRLAPAVFEEQERRAKAAWRELRDGHRRELLAEIRAAGEVVIEEVRRRRELMAQAAAEWQRLDADAYALIRAEYITGSHGSGELPPFPGLDGPLRPAVPREFQPALADPTIRSTKAVA
jgi:hypothetical protein